jgi:SAM-dependent methyltransferase
MAEATDPLVTSHAVEYFRDGLPQGPAIPLPELRRRLRLLPKYERLLDFLLGVLREDGLAEVDGDAVRFLPAMAAAPFPAETRRALETRFPGFGPLYDLIDHCGHHYPAALSGEVPGLAVLYPDGSSELFSRQGEGPNAAARLLREVLAAAVRERPSNDPPYRILEIGAGQGTLTAELLPALNGREVEYHFTDVGRAFVLRAERRAREAGQGFLRFGMLDVTRDPASQGFAPGTFDAVIGADVVHATPRLAETLANLRSLLAPGGLLGLVETVHPQRWGTLVWGLTDGWWSFEDGELRRGSPLLGPEAWEGLLARCGFAEPQACSGAGDSALLVARRPAERVEGTKVLFVRDLAEARTLREPERTPLSAVLHTADPPTFRYLAALAERRTGILALLWESEDGIGPAADLLLAKGVTAARRSGGDHPEAPESVEERLPALPSPAALQAIHDRPLLRNPYVAPRDETERAVAEIWSRALGIERIGALDNFLELGGDSLVGLQVVHAVQARFDLDGRTFSLYEHPTVDAIARFVAEDTGGERADPFEARSSRGELRRDRRTSLKRTRP